jgi:epsilon-lactone hydrolase
MSRLLGTVGRALFKLVALLPGLLIVPWVLLGTSLRRLFGLRAHPDWTFRHEFVFTTFHLIGRSVIGASIPFMRAGLLEPPASWRPRGIDLQATTIAGRPAEITTPRTWLDGDPSILYFHGGGYGVCSPATHRGIVTNLAIATGFRCVSLDYRMAPEDPFPAAVDDAVAAWKVLCDASEGPLFVAGDSAGGGLTLTMMLRLKELGERMPTAAAVLSPWADLALTGPTHGRWAHTDYLSYPLVETFAKAYVGDEDVTNPLISPVHGDFTGFPPVIVQYAELEVLRWDAEEVIRRMEADGVDVKADMWPAMVHVFQGFDPLVPEARPALRRLGNWLKAHVGEE